MQGIDKDVVSTLGHPLARFALGAGALALLVIAAMGGFREASARQEPLPQVGAGTVAASGAYEVTPLCAYTTDHMPGRRDPDAAKRYLVLQARVVNRMEVDWSGYLERDVVWPADGSGRAGPAEWVLRTDDGSLGPQLPPRIPAHVSLVWPLPADAPPASVLGRWGLYQRTRMKRTLDTGEHAWLQQGPSTLLVLPIGTACSEVGA